MKNKQNIKYKSTKSLENSLIKFAEYASFAKNTIIGDVYSKDPLDKLKATILHEVAHAVQYFHYKETCTTCKPHGPVFKEYYTLLRKNLLNNELPKQNLLKKEYEDYVNKLNKFIR